MAKNRLGEYKVCLAEPADLKVLVFPDDPTRAMALEDEVIMGWFGDPPDLPIMATVEECLSF